MSKIVLKAGKERSLYRLHPWVFSGAIAKIKGDVQEGDVVQVYNSDDEYLATGHYQIGSIAVRVLGGAHPTGLSDTCSYRFGDQPEQQRVPPRSRGR